MAARTAAPGGGSVAGLVAALAAALVDMAARYADDDETARRAAAWRTRCLELSEKDSAAYAAVLGTTGEARERALSRAADVPLALAETAAEITEAADRLAATGNPTLRGDAEAAGFLARAAARAAANLVEINLEGHDDPRVERARELVRRDPRTSSR